MRAVRYRGSTLDYLTLYPEGYAAGTPYPLLFWLHGFGADLRDLAGLARAVHRSGYLHVLPNGPLPASGEPGAAGRAWYERGGNETPEGVRRALGALEVLAGEVLGWYGVPAGQSLLLGFSQGGAVALRYGLPRPGLFAGIASLSGSLRRAEDLLAGLPVSRTQAVFIAHGTHDPLVPVEWGQRIADLLQAEGYRPEFRTYPSGHQVSPASAAELRDWVLRTLPPGRAGSSQDAASGP